MVNLNRWRLAGFRRQHGPLEESLIESAQTEDEIDLNYWLPSWFFLSVAVMVFWCWFFWGASKIAKSEGSLLWSDPNFYIKTTIGFTLLFNIIWLVWLCFINYRKTLLCMAAGTLGFIIVCGFALLLKGSDRLHLIGFVAVALTFASNFCRMMSSGRPQFSKLGLSVAIAGAVAGALWVPKGFYIDYFSADVDEHGFKSVLFKKNFFWKFSSAVGSIFRGRDLVFLLTMLASESRNLLWFVQKVASGSRSLQLKMTRTWLWCQQQVAGSTDAQI